MTIIHYNPTNRFKLSEDYCVGTEHCIIIDYESGDVYIISRAKEPDFGPPTWICDGHGALFVIPTNIDALDLKKWMDTFLLLKVDEIRSGYSSKPGEYYSTGSLTERSTAALQELRAEANRITEFCKPIAIFTAEEWVSAAGDLGLDAHATDEAIEAIAAEMTANAASKDSVISGGGRIAVARYIKRILRGSGNA